jgi:hypothetical protein
MRLTMTAGLVPSTQPWTVSKFDCPRQRHVGQVVIATQLLPFANVALATEGIRFTAFVASTSRQEKQ